MPPLSFLVLIALSCLLPSCFAINNGLGLTPAMGYNTWNDFRCNNISETTIKAAADAIIRQGLNKLGYIYVNIDDCWAKRRDDKGRIVPDPETFPNGMKAVADYVHSKGLKFGIYTDRGSMTCALRPGSWNYESVDAETYAEWGVDYLKEDSCYAVDIKEVAFWQYSLMKDALNKTGRPIYFSLCGWHNWYADGGAAIANSWRIAGDCNSWPDVTRAIDTNAPLHTYAGPGGWNDPDMLIGTNPNAAVYLTPDQSRTMFSMWAVMAAPLLIGSSILQLNPFDTETFTNTEVIALNQDPLGIQAIRLVGGDLSTGKSKTNVWGKKTVDGSWALVFLNNDDNTADITCDSSCFAQMGFSKTDVLKVRDLWKHENIGVTTGLSYTTSAVRKSGGSVTLKFTKSNSVLNLN